MKIFTLLYTQFFLIVSVGSHYEWTSRNAVITADGDIRSPTHLPFKHGCKGQPIRTPLLGTDCV